jgi:hypothetical protein
MTMQEIGCAERRADIDNLLQQVKAERGLAASAQGQMSNDWWKRFYSRHPEITSKRAEPYNAGKARKCTWESIDRWFTYYERNFQAIKPKVLINADETCSQVKRKAQVLAVAGERVQVNEFCSADDKISGIVCIMTTTTDPPQGKLLAPALVFLSGRSGGTEKKAKRARLQRVWFKDTMPDTCIGVSPNGSATVAIWRNFAHHLARQVPDHMRPALLLTDNLAGHLDLEVNRVFRENNIHAMVFPPNATQVIQPLDTHLFGPLKGSLSQLYANHVKREHDRVPKNELSGIFCRALREVSSPALIVKAFADNGLFPIDRKRVLKNKLLKLSGCAEERFPAEDVHPASVISPLGRLYEWAQGDHPAAFGAGKDQMRRAADPPSTSQAEQPQLTAICCPASIGSSMEARLEVFRRTIINLHSPRAATADRQWSQSSLHLGAQTSLLSDVSYMCTSFEFDHEIRRRKEEAKKKQQENAEKRRAKVRAKARIPAPSMGLPQSCAANASAPTAAIVVQAVSGHPQAQSGQHDPPVRSATGIVPRKKRSQRSKRPSADSKVKPGFRVRVPRPRKRTKKASSLSAAIADSKDD